MADKSVTMRVAVDGDSAFKSSLTQCNTEIKSMESALKLVQAQYQNSANSEEALRAKSEALANVMTAVQNKLTTLTNAQKNAQNSEAQWKATITQLKTELESTQSAIAGMSTDAQNYGTQWNSLSAQLKNAEAELQRLQRSSADTSTEEAELAQKIDTLKTQMGNLNTATNGTAEQAGNLITQEKNLSSEISNAESKLTRASNRVNYYGEQINKTKIQEANLNAEQQRTSQYLSEAQNSVTKTATSIDQYGKKVKEATQATKENNEAQQQAQEAYGALTSFLMMSGLSSAFKEIASAMEECVSASANFNYTMATVEAVSSATSDDMTALNEQAIEWSTSTIYTAQEVADAYTVMGRAGMESSEMLDALPGVINLAAAAGEDLDSMTSTIVNNLNAFGETSDQASRYADVLAETAADSNTTVAQLSDAFTQCASTAGTLGYSIEDTSTLLGLMANRGITGAAAGTQLSVALTRMAGGTQAAADQLEELGVSMFDESGEARDLTDFFTDLRASMAGMTDEEKILVEKTLGGQRGMRGLGAIINATDEEFQSLTDSITDSTGAAEEMSNVQLDNLEGDTKLLESALEALEIEVGNQLTPAMRNLTQAGTEALTWIKDFIAEHEAVIPVITGVATALGTFVVSLTAIAAVKGAIGAIMTVMGASLGPVAIAAGAAAAAIGLLAAAFVDSSSELEGAKQEYSSFTDEVQQAASDWDETTAGLDKQKQSASVLMSTLTELMGIEDKDAATKAEIKEVVSQLNESYDGLNLSYDEQYDRLNKNISTIQDYIDEMVREAEVSAITAEIVTQKQLEAEALENVAKAEKVQADAQEQLTKDVEAHAGALTILKDQRAYDDATTELEGYHSALGDANWQVGQLEGELKELIGAEEENADASEEAASSTTDLAEEEEATAAAAEEEAKAHEKANETLKDIASELRTVSGSGDELMDTYEELEKEYENLDGAGDEWRSNIVKQELEALKLTAMATQLAEQLPLVGDNFSNLATVIEASGYSVDEFVDSYNDALDSMVGGFDEIEIDSDNTLNAWIKSMDKRTEVTETWNGNMEVITNALSDGTIVDRAKPAFQEAVQTIMDGGIETYGQCAIDLANAIENGDWGTAWALVNSVNAAGDQARAAAINQFALATGQTTTAIEDLISAGALTIAEDGSVQITDAVAVAAAGIDTGITSETDTATTAATTLISSVADAVLESDTQTAFENSGKALIQYMCNGISAKGDDVTSALKSIISTATFKADTIAVTQGKNIGQYLDAGVANGIRNNASQVTAAMTNVITAAVNAAKAEAGISSPSKVMREQVGKWLPAGIAEGIKANQATVDQAMSGLMTSVKNKADTTLPVTTNNNQQMTVDLTINATEKQNARDIAQMTLDLLNQQIRKKKGAFA